MAAIHYSAHVTAQPWNGQLKNHDNSQTTVPKQTFHSDTSMWRQYPNADKGCLTGLQAVPQVTRVQSSQLFKLLGADPWPKSKGVELVHVSWPDLSDIPPWSSRTWKSNTPASMEIYERRSSLHVWVNMKTNDGIVSEAALGNPLRDGVQHAWVFQSAKIPSWAEKNWTLSSASKDNELVFKLFQSQRTNSWQFCKSQTRVDNSVNLRGQAADNSICLREQVC